MHGINLARVVLGGLLAGLVIDVGEFLFNGWLFAADMEAAMRQLNLPPPGGGAIATFLIMGFALGIATVWLYAAIRPRLGPGVSTALCAGATVWFLAYVYTSVGLRSWGFSRRGSSSSGSRGGLVNCCLPPSRGRGSIRSRPRAWRRADGRRPPRAAVALGFHALPLISAPRRGRRVAPPTSERARASSTAVPERQDLYAVRVCGYPVIQVVPDSGQEQPTNAYKREIPRACTHAWLDGDEAGRAL